MWPGSPVRRCKPDQIAGPQASQLRGPCDPRPDAPVGPGMAPYQLTGALHLFGEAFRQRQGKRALKSVDPCPVRSAGLLTSEAL